MEVHSQVAVIPYVSTHRGIEILTITSKGTRQWIVPKGWLNDKLGPEGSAAREALEEAGVEGEISDGPIGSYSYKKRLHVFSSVTCTVSVFTMHVSRQRLHWREKHLRELNWLRQDEAAKLVKDRELALLVGRLQDGAKNDI
ncbi:MAG: hypothetical protein RLZ98_617 [Pseudomonadota bacterium]